jgi:hypothetical protein
LVLLVFLDGNEIVVKPQRLILVFHQKHLAGCCKMYLLWVTKYICQTESSTPIRIKYISKWNQRHKKNIIIPSLKYTYCLFVWDTKRVNNSNNNAPWVIRWEWSILWPNRCWDFCQRN